MNKKDKFMLICGACAGIAAKEIMKAELMYKKKTGGLIEKTGCVILEWYAGASAGFGVIGMMSKIDEMIFGKKTDEEETNG